MNFARELANAIRGLPDHEILQALRDTPQFMDNVKKALGLDHDEKPAQKLDRIRGRRAPTTSRSMPTLAKATREVILIHGVRCLVWSRGNTYFGADEKTKLQRKNGPIRVEASTRDDVLAVLGQLVARYK